MATEATVKEIAAALGMTPKEMIKEWKTCPDNATPEERRTLLTKAEKDAIKTGITNGTMTY